MHTKRSVQSEQTYQKLLNAIYKHKNERSWLQSIGTHHAHEGEIYAGATVWQGMRYIISPNMPDLDVSPANTHQGFYYRMGNYISIGGGI